MNGQWSMAKLETLNGNSSISVALLYYLKLNAEHLTIDYSHLTLHVSFFTFDNSLFTSNNLPVSPVIDLMQFAVAHRLERHHAIYAFPS